MITLVVYAIIFVLLFAIVTWLAPAGVPRNVCYSIVALLAILVLLQITGLWGGHAVLRVC